MKFSEQITTSTSDEYYSPKNVVNMILPYILRGGYRTIWCPFDTADSNFVKIFRANGLEVNHGHIRTGQDFFDYDEPQGDIAVSNPPFSIRDQIFKRLYELDVPFAMVMNFNGLFDSRTRHKLFRENGVELLVPSGRMTFIQEERGKLNHPNFQSIYVCHRLLGEQITFDTTYFKRSNKQ